ncbi:hypothetical protein A584_02793 [Pseudomonas syringae pv. theae ICMP 3923]|uniref:Uncharacterized protein n=2 Tax=Pseudomonas savastanoi pv. glycinea TaxID=318 RepID=A0A3M4IF00_PSESG|nr:hypothetical protein PsgB076_05568 [Pseudomonas savastanoi pv. glycinea str. B076]EFW83256.1 hypothetical protein PsgRace4_25911 [Pseudomonas savastanoi pv. glycinea str. race 4]EPM73070.1 hypothetical protein A584_02793 [Pseudomonas syringae pv. theae ICMP 3923]RML35102.1 hypothetical protein ALQ97_103332 [Pseudomonas savastanoi pv. glycinea]EGH14879.1 hypothetical protein Pgy4_17994 [Pseudomonas savastanoi pv. glycinea str. race 4]
MLNLGGCLRFAVLDLALGFGEQAAFAQLEYVRLRAAICQIKSRFLYSSLFSTPVYPASAYTALFLHGAVRQVGFMLGAMNVTNQS